VLTGFLTFIWIKPHLVATLSPSSQPLANPCGQTPCRRFRLVVKNTGHWNAHNVGCTVAVLDVKGAIVAEDDTPIGPGLKPGPGPTLEPGQVIEQALYVHWPPDARQARATCFTGFFKGPVPP